MSKHIITEYNIVNDYKTTFKLKTGKAFIIGLFSFSFLFLIVYLNSQIENHHLYMTYGDYFLEMSLFVILSSTIIYCIYLIITAFCDLFAVKSGKYRIVTASLAQIKEKQYHPNTTVNFLFKKRCRLHTLTFEKYGKYCILPENYTSNSYTVMTDDEVANFSAIKDVFMLVINKKNKILLIYNTKLFEYQK